MWTDNETNRDLLNFRGVAKTAAEMIIQAKGKPISLGICGSWGVGKSSMIKLLHEELSTRRQQSFVFVEFNAWLYQGYDDARAALMDVIAQKLLEYAEENKKPTERVLEFLGRVRWARVAGLGVGVAASIAAGMPLPGVAGAVSDAIQGLTNRGLSKETVDAAKDAGKQAVETAKGLIAEKAVPSPPKEIHDLRDHFEATLQQIGATLVVLIDDLDRCLPETAISTLEAIRLFLFLDQTAFVVAADDKMIRQAVRVHFKNADLDDDLVTNYFDKLIQVPLRVPPLGTQDVRAYLMLLFVEESSLTAEKKEEVRAAVCKRLGETWTGKRVDRTFVVGLIPNCPDTLKSQIELADRLAPLMSTADKIAGNPRLIKRFLNTLMIRQLIAGDQSVSIDESALAKLLLFERCAHPDAYAELVTSINSNDEGKPAFLKPWEEQASRGSDIELKGVWDKPFVRQWLALSPPLADHDMRGITYVSREHLPIITAADELSSEASDLLEGLLALKTQSDVLTARLKDLPKREVGQIMDRLLVRARQEQAWGTPPILFAALSVAAVENDRAEVLGRFLRQVPATQLSPSIIPLLADRPWAEPVLAHWAGLAETPDPVKRAVANIGRKKN
jgi:predicted KAP-like P-loop ATPase